MKDVASCSIDLVEMVTHEGDGVRSSCPHSFDGQIQSYCPSIKPEVDGTKPEEFSDQTPLPNLLTGVRFIREGPGKTTGTDEYSATFNCVSSAHDGVATRRWGEKTGERSLEPSWEVLVYDPLTPIFHHESIQEQKDHSRYGLCEKARTDLPPKTSEENQHKTQHWATSVCHWGKIARLIRYGGCSKKEVNHTKAGG